MDLKKIGLDTGLRIIDMFNNKKYIRIFVILCVAIVVPTLIESVYLSLNPTQYGGGYSIFETMPSISDEVWYYNQIKSMVTYGKPLGYYGYDGSHAAIGTFGAWGWFLLIPHYSICKFFGIHLYSGTIINILFFAILILLYGLLFRSFVQDCIAFGVILFAPFTLFYFDGWLMEGIIVFWGVLTAVWMNYIEKEGYNKRSMSLLLLIITFAAMSKVTWSLLIIPMLVIFFNREETNATDMVRQSIIVLFLSVISITFFYSFYRMFSAPYFPGSYGVYRVGDIIKNEGIMYAFIYLIRTICVNLALTFSNYENLLYNICVAYVVFSIVVSIIWAFKERKKTIRALIPLIVLGGFVLGIITFYDGGIGAIKNISPAATFVLVYIYCQGNRNFMKMIFCGSAVFMLLTIGHQYMVGDQYVNIHDRDKDMELSSLQEHMDYVKIDSKTENMWDNTVAFSIYDGNPGDNAVMLLPTGAGIMLYRELPTASEMKEKYVFLTEANIDRKTNFTSQGYYVLDEFDGNTLLCR